MSGKEENVERRGMGVRGEGGRRDGGDLGFFSTTVQYSSQIACRSLMLEDSSDEPAQDGTLADLDLI